MLNETWDGKRLQKELSKLRNEHEDELVEYASANPGRTEKATGENATETESDNEKG